MKYRVSAIQCALSDNEAQNIEKVLGFAEEAVEQGANVILPSELFQGHYFCTEKDQKHFSRACSIEESASVKAFVEFSAKHKVAVPVSFFEKAPEGFYNSMVWVADGRVEGLYRKSHIPEGPGYEEKYYFKEGDTGFKVWKYRDLTVGVGICWDQWFPETARALCLLGAELLLYPTAIGSEPLDASMDTSKPWQRVMIGHAVANAVPVVAANRVGTENGQTYYGHSFICDQSGEKLSEFGSKVEGVLTQEFDTEVLKRHRESWRFFYHRRPELYGVISKPRG
jgi:N-carbamoylputrescine amidase